MSLYQTMASSGDFEQQMGSSVQARTSMLFFHTLQKLQSDMPPHKRRLQYLRSSESMLIEKSEPDDDPVWADFCQDAAGGHSTDLDSSS